MRSWELFYVRGLHNHVGSILDKHRYSSQVHFLLTKTEVKMKMKNVLTMLQPLRDGKGHISSPKYQVEVRKLVARTNITFPVDICTIMTQQV